MDEDRRVYNAKNQGLKPTASKTSDAQEPRQHAPYKKKGPIYAISEDDQSGVVAAVREPGWNVRERDTEGKTQQSRKSASASPKSSYDQNKFCKYHDMKGHDTKECRHLYEAWLASTSTGRTEIEQLKQKTTKNGKSWSKSKDKKKNSNEKEEEDSPPADDGDQSHHDEESTSDEEKSKSRQKIFTIRATPSPAPSTTGKPEDDLRQSLNQKSVQTIESLTSTDSTLMEVDGAPLRISCYVGKLNASDARHILDAKRKDPFHRQYELKWELWSNNQSDGIETTDLRVKLTSKILDLRKKLKQCKTDRSKVEPKPIVLYQRKTQDLRTRLDSLRANRTTRSEKEHQEQFQRLNVIMGGSPPGNDFVRSVKAFRQKAFTAKPWPTTPEASPQITFSAEDAAGVHMPHNNSLLVDIGISDCTVTKVLVDTGSSVDLIFKSTLVKMGISLDDMKPSVRSLTAFNGSIETMLGTIRLRVYAEGIAKNFKFSVIDVRAPYNAILGTPWIHAMKAIRSTYHQCIKFPGNDGRIITLRGDQADAQDLLIAEVKNQKATSHVNAVAKPIHKTYL
ncbi:hypothetical protein YC2023_019194 [Brassica napus]